MQQGPSKSKELALTIKQLESAIRDWDEIKPDSEGKNASPQELTVRTQSLLKKLKQQIDELSD